MFVYLILYATMNKKHKSTKGLRDAKRLGQLRKMRQYVVAIILLMLFIYAALWYFQMEMLIEVMLATIVLLLATGFVIMQRFISELHQERHQDFRQLEALVSLQALLKFEAPFPLTRGYAASPDFLKLLVEVIFELQPHVIVELGSGVSSILIGYALKHIGHGKIVAVDHDAHYAAITKKNVTLHNLEDWVEVITAPLKDTQIGAEKYIWYDVTDLKKVGCIDILVVDGPPSKVQKKARYPAVPLLHEQLSDSAVVIVDDGYREDETRMVQQWVDAFGDLTYEPRYTETGAYLIRRNTAS